MVDYFESPGPEVAQQTLFVKTEPGSVVPLMLGHLEQTDHRADARRLHAIHPLDNERSSLAGQRHSPAIDRVIAERTL